MNFIAAYGTHETITRGDDRRGQAGCRLEARVRRRPERRRTGSHFLNGTGGYAPTKLGGLEDIDLWVGGMAEKKMAFGGMLGSTFSSSSSCRWRTCRTATASTTCPATRA